MRTWQRLIKPFVVWTLVVLMTIDSAAACRFYAPPCYRPVHTTCRPVNVCCAPCGSQKPSVSGLPETHTPPLTPAPAPSDHLFGKPPEGKKPEDKPTEGLDDLFGKPEDKKPENKPADDLFGKPEDKTPEDDPKDGRQDDLFGKPEDEKPEDKPKDDGVDDLFGNPDEKPEDKPKDGGPDDLFGAPDKEKMPKENGAADDLFGATEDKAADKKPVDDLFGDPEDKADLKPAEGQDDLFDDLLAPETNGISGDDKEPAAQLDAAAPQKATLVTRPVVRTTDPGGLASRQMRNWVDNTGTYRCVGRVIQVGPHQIRLMKSNGRNSTVPMSRLSPADKQFIDAQLKASRDKVAGRTVRF